MGVINNTLTQEYAILYRGYIVDDLPYLRWDFVENDMCNKQNNLLNDDDGKEEDNYEVNI